MSVATSLSEQARFMRNKLTTLDLPEGVIYVGVILLNINGLTSVKFQRQVASQAFGKNEITVLDFPENGLSVQADGGAFGVNKITSVQLPANTSKLDKKIHLLIRIMGSGCIYSIQKRLEHL